MEGSSEGQSTEVAAENGETAENAETAGNAETPRRPSSSRGNQARQVAVNFMPSRQLPYNTLRHRRNASEHNNLLDEVDGAEGEAPGDEEESGEDGDTVEKRAEIIVKELEQQHQLMDDSPFSEELRREALRDLAQGLTMKRNVRAKLSVSVSLRSKRRPISLFRRTKYRVSFAWKRTKERLRDCLFSVELWYEAIRDIEGQFGSAVGSYFRMLRRLFVINLALAVVLFGFVVLPQALYDHGVIHNVTTSTDDQRDLASASGTLNIVEWYSEQNVTRPADDRNSTIPEYEQASATFNIVDWVREQGRLQSSVLFYGHYHAWWMGAADGSGAAYHMPAAYFFTMLCLYLVFFAVLCYRTADSYRRHFIETAGGLSHVFANKVFCGWDFGIVSAHAARLNATSIYHELQELLNEQNSKPTNRTFWTKVFHRSINVAVTSLVLASIGGVLFGVWTFLRAYSEREIAVSVLIAACVGLCPVAFHLVGRVERYSARVSLYVELFRTWLLQAAVLVLLFVYWAHSGTKCWETRFGQETYRLMMLDASVSLVVLPAVEIFRALLYKFRPKGDPPEFNIAYNSLTLMYNQALVWAGLLYSPMLATAVTIKLLFLFYVRRECAVRTCQPARKVWRAAQTQTVMYMLVTLSLFVTLFAVGSVFLRMESRSCGPFRAHAHALDVLARAVRLEAIPAAANALGWLRRPGVVAFAVLLLCVLVYYGRARARAQRSMVGILRHMLVLQAKDKDFLLTAIGKVSNGEWLYSPKPSDEGAESHTVRYLRDVRKPSNSSYNFDASRLSRADRPRSGRPTSHAEPAHAHAHDGDTDSSFSWQGSGTNLHNSTPN